MLRLNGAIASRDRIATIAANCGETDLSVHEYQIDTHQEEPT
ncbi:hypothetical protein [Burkholderia cenocepacia]|nr:hypothetical protein [Burkholderia cenocepacia]